MANNSEFLELPAADLSALTVHPDPRQYLYALETACAHLQAASVFAPEYRVEVVARLQEQVAELLLEWE